MQTDVVVFDWHDTYVAHRVCAERRGETPDTFLGYVYVTDSEARCDLCGAKLLEPAPERDPGVAS